MPKRSGEKPLQQQRYAEVAEEIRRLRRMVVDVDVALTQVTQRVREQERLSDERTRQIIEETAEIVRLKAELSTLAGDVGSIKTQVEAPKP